MRLNTCCLVFNRATYVYLIHNLIAGHTLGLPTCRSTGLIAHKWGLFLRTYAHSLGHIGGNVMSPSHIDGVGG
jgi:hypothetical protein